MRALAYAVAAVLASVAACGPPVRTGPAPSAAAVRVALVDSVPFSTEMHDGVLRRVEVRTPAGVDTVSEVLTHALPVVLPDGRVLGFAWDGPDLVEAFVYHAAARRLERMPLPDDADRAFTTPAFSPDGRYLAYVVYSEGYGRGMVRLGVRGPVMVRTDSVSVPATDAAVSFAEWPGAEAFEIYLDVGETGWHRFRGTVSDGVTANDTVTVSDDSGASGRAP